jgi:NADPH:quinone reductase-like Zn-dependent oxidoreductase
VRAIAGDGGADVALDLFGGDGREAAFALLRSGGRLASVAQPPPEPRDGYEVHYIFVRPDGDELRELAELVRGGQLRPHVEEVFPLERAAEAHERLEGGHVRGKLVLSVPA